LRELNTLSGVVSVIEGIGMSQTDPVKLKPVIDRSFVVDTLTPRILVDLHNTLDELGLELTRRRSVFSSSAGTIRMVWEISRKGGKEDHEKAQLSRFGLSIGQNFSVRTFNYRITGTQKARGQGNFWVIASLQFPTSRGHGRLFKFPPAVVRDRLKF